MRPRGLEASGIDVSELGLGQLDEPLLYDLYAVDEHIGGLGGGHYRAYAHNHRSDQWYHFDDSYVKKAQSSDAVVSLSSSSLSRVNLTRHRILMRIYSSTSDAPLVPSAV